MKERVFYACAECGYQSVRWLGKCPNCGAWSSFAEEVSLKRKPSAGPAVEPKKIEDIAPEDFLRTATGIGEFDRVLGGGMVKGSLVLLAGEPGIGKSTLLLSMAGKVAAGNKTVLYVTGEESFAQVKLRARRLSVSSNGLYLLSTTEVPCIKESLAKLKPDLVIIDSIQAIYDPDLPTTPGSVTQVRENTCSFMGFAKKSGTCVCLVGHITKEGAIAGPKIMEHMVDVVLYFEGESQTSLRILRGVKNRFGSTQEIGVFSMQEDGLREIPEASTLFLPDTRSLLPGSVIFPAQEGTRTILVELQSLVTPTYYGLPKRSVSGLDYNRVSLIIAVLEKKLHFNFGTHDVYVNVGGGLKVEEPGCDLAAALACVSSLKDLPGPEASVCLGELALTGEIRPVSQIEMRLKETRRLGFKKALVPQGNLREIKTGSLEIVPVQWLKDAVPCYLKP